MVYETKCENVGSNPILASKTQWRDRLAEGHPLLISTYTINADTEAKSLHQHASGA